MNYDTFEAKRRSDSQAGMDLDDTTSRTVDDGAITSTKPVSLVNCPVIGQNPHGRTHATIHTNSLLVDGFMGMSTFSWSGKKHNISGSCSAC